MDDLVIDIDKDKAVQHVPQHVIHPPLEHCQVIGPTNPTNRRVNQRDQFVRAPWQKMRLEEEVATVQERRSDSGWLADGVAALRGLKTELPSSIGSGPSCIDLCCESDASGGCISWVVQESVVEKPRRLPSASGQNPEVNSEVHHTPLTLP